MVLNFGGGGLFTHSNAFDQGSGKVRVGAATIVVSLDGSGDTDSIPDAVKLLPSAGGIILIKDGTYVIKETIALNKTNIALMGSGRATNIYIDSVDIPAITIEQDGCMVQDLRISGDGTLGGGIVISADLNYINNVWMDSMAYGVQATAGTDSLVVSKCRINDMGATAIGLTAGAGLIVANCIIEECIIENVVSWGILIMGVGAGSDMRDCKIINNIIINADSVNTTTKSGIYVNSGYNNAAYDGNVTRITVAGNLVKDGGHWGIEVNNVGIGTLTNTMIMGNTTFNNVSGAITDNGTNTLPNGAVGTTNLALDDLNVLA